MSKPSSSIDRHLGERIRQQRNLLGMSQEKMARSIGLTLRQLQKYENGEERVSAGHLQEFARILLVSPIFFFNENSAPATKPEASGETALADSRVEFRDPGEGLKLYRAFSAIRDARMRKLIVNLVVVLARTEAAARRRVRPEIPEQPET